MIGPLDATVDANEAIAANPVGGYCAFNIYPRHGLQVCLDGDFDIEDIRRVLSYLEMIEEEMLK